MLVLLTVGSALQLSLKDGEERCVSEDVGKNELLVGEFTSDALIGVGVTAPSGSSVYSKSQSGEGKFAYTADVAGDYRICFRNQANGVRTITFIIRTGMETKDYSSAAKKDNLKPLEVELRRLEDTVTQIHNDMLYMKAREEAMRATNDSTSSRVLWFSFLSMFVLVSLGLSQVMYLKRYFQSKKLID